MTTRSQPRAATPPQATAARLRLRLVGIGAMASPRYRPAGLLVLHPRGAVLLDGEPEPDRDVALSAWLLTDARSELRAAIRRSARARGVDPVVAAYDMDGLAIVPHPVAHTSHPTFGYRLQWHARTAVWAPEFWQFPAWADAVDLMFAEAAGWNRPIRFRGGVGGHACVLDVAEQARRRGVRRLVFAHLGRPSIRALESGERPPYGEIGRENAEYCL